MLASRGLRVVDETRASGFGNALVHLVARDLEVQLIRDRWTVEVAVRAPRREKWWGLKVVMGFLTRDPAWESWTELPKGDEPSNLHQRWDDIVLAVTDQQRQLAEFAEQRSARIIESLRRLGRS